MYWHVIPSLQSALLHISFKFNKTSDLNENSSNIPGSVRLSNITNLKISRLIISIGNYKKILYISSHGTTGKIKSIQSFLISKPQSFNESTVTIFVTISFIIIGFWEAIEITSLNINQQIEFSTLNSKKELDIECKICNTEIAHLTNPIVTQLPLNNNLNDIFCAECEADIPNLSEKTPKFNELFLDIDNYIININNLILNNFNNSNCENCSKLYHNYQSITTVPTVLDSENESLSPRNLRLDKIRLYKGDFGFIGDTFGYYKYRREFLSTLMPINHLLKLSIIQSDVPFTKESISIIVTSRDIYLLPIFISSLDNIKDPITKDSILVDDISDSIEEDILEAKSLFDSIAPIIGKRVLWKRSNYTSETSTIIALSSISYNYLLESLMKYTLSNPENKQTDLKISAIPI